MLQLCFSSPLRRQGHVLTSRRQELSSCECISVDTDARYCPKASAGLGVGLSTACFRRPMTFSVDIRNVSGESLSLQSINITVD